MKTLVITNFEASLKHDCKYFPAYTEKFLKFASKLNQQIFSQSLLSHSVTAPLILDCILLIRHPATKLCAKECLPVPNRFKFYFKGTADLHLPFSCVSSSAC